MSGRQSDQEQRVREAADGGWTYDGRAQPYVSDLRAVLRELDDLRRKLAELDRYRIACEILGDCWSDRYPHGTFERYTNMKPTT